MGPLKKAQAKTDEKLLLRIWDTDFTDQNRHDSGNIVIFIYRGAPRRMRTL